MVRSIRIDPGNTSKILAGGSICGIRKTKDKGNTWRFVSGGVPEVRWVNDIMFVKSNPLIVYAGTDMGIVKSTDGLSLQVILTWFMLPYKKEENTQAIFLKLFF